MDWLNEKIAKLPKLFGKFGLTQEDKLGELKKFAELEAFRLDSYYEFWRAQIYNAADTNQILSNGWAFSTLGGLSSFERFIRTTEEIQDIYFSKKGEIVLTVDRIIKEIGQEDLGGVILYGYGNLLRESYFIEQATISNLLKSQRIYLIDCSLFYHILANSPLNPLRNIVNIKQIKTLLLDYLDDPNYRDQLIYIRDDLYTMRPVLHLFLGNTFGNTESSLLHKTLDTIARPGDFVIGEYMQYSDEDISNPANDQVSEMAQIATSELFSVDLNSVTAQNIKKSPTSKVTEIHFIERDSERPITFQSMLRRNYSKSELTDGRYILVSSEPTLKGKIYLDAYKRV